MGAMDLTQRPHSDPTALLRYRDGIYAADFLACGIVKLDLFSWLAGREVTLGEICRHFDIHERPADVLMTLACANGLVVRKADCFSATELASEHLSGQSPWSLGPYYASLADRPVVKEVFRVLKTGRPAKWESGTADADWHQSMESQDFARMFTAAMDCRGVFLGQRLAEKIDLEGRKSLLDIGGGSGVYACCLVAESRLLRATVLEKSPVDGIARKLIAERALEAQVAVVEGDMFEAAYPHDHDVHLLSNVLHDWDIPEVEELLAKSYAALPRGGLLIAHEAFLNEDKTGPRAVAEYSTILVSITRGRCYGIGEIRQYMEQAGFVEVRHFETGGDRSAITARKP